MVKNYYPKKSPNPAAVGVPIGRRTRSKSTPSASQDNATHAVDALTRDVIALSINPPLSPQVIAETPISNTMIARPNSPSASPASAPAVAVATSTPIRKRKPSATSPAYAALHGVDTTPEKRHRKRATSVNCPSPIVAPHTTSIVELPPVVASSEVVPLPRKKRTPKLPPAAPTTSQLVASSNRATATRRSARTSKPTDRVKQLESTAVLKLMN